MIRVLELLQDLHELHGKYEEKYGEKYSGKILDTMHQVRDDGTN